MRTLKRTVLAVAAIVGGCAVQPPAPVSERGSAIDTAPETTPGLTAVPETAPAPVENLAVASLMDDARADLAAGRLARAGASLERALRIDPRNPRLWQELARVRLKQGDYAQAESVAARSNSWARGDEQLRAENWRLIAQAREARGDVAGARAALQAAGQER